MDPKLLMVKLITLHYKESQQLESNERSVDLSRQLLAKVRLPDGGMDGYSQADVLHNLKATIGWMNEQQPGYRFDRQTLLQRIRVNTQDDETLYYAIEQGVEGSQDPDELKRQVLDLRHELRTLLREIQVKAIFKAGFNKLNFDSDKVDWRTFVAEQITLLEPLAGSGDDDHVEGLVSRADFSDDESLVELLASAKDQLNAIGGFRSPWQALNRMLGEHGVFRPGETVLVGGLQHNFKSGFMRSLFKGACLYTTPHLINPSKKPLILFVSLEDEADQSILWLYRNLKENELKERIDVSAIDPREATRYVRDRLTATGYSVQLLRLDPSEVSFQSIFDLVAGLEAKGYEVKALFIDYLNKMTKKGCYTGAMGFEVRDLYRRLRNFTSARKITFFTPHQLSTEAKELVRRNVEDLVKEVANKGYYDSCKTIDQEVDLEVMIHIVKINGRSYLTIQRGKHRGVLTPEKFLYAVLPFSPFGDILDDLDGPDSSMAHPGSDIGGGDNSQTPFWQ